uniref:Uncharacterized protein n=1 Tax=Branchiostoma floridae TaxID=7739 RepID=C3Z152_BRAFL|eukprot:XP_002597739.1 hypothetical protein BRAFLDRAFT_77358 [Branchiostoma floridae]
MENPTYAPGEDTTPMEEPQTDWQAQADAAVNVSDPMYASIPDATPMEQEQADSQDLAHAAASGNNPAFDPAAGTIVGKRRRKVPFKLKTWTLRWPPSTTNISLSADTTASLVTSNSPGPDPFLPKMIFSGFT